MRTNPTGTIGKIRLIKSYPTMLVRFSLITDDGSLNCIAHGEIAQQLMYMEDDKYSIASFGHYNRRKQFIIEKMWIKNPDSYILEFVMKNKRFA